MEKIKYNSLDEESECEHSLFLKSSRTSFLLLPHPDTHFFESKRAENYDILGGNERNRL